MSKKSFQGVPTPKLLTDDAIESFEKAGSGHDPGRGKAFSRNNAPRRAENQGPTKRLSIDVPVAVHRRFKTACSATSRQMVAELRHFIEVRILELEKEMGSGEANGPR